MEKNKTALAEHQSATWANVQAQARYNDQLNLNSRYDELLKDFQAVNMEIRELKSELKDEKLSNSRQILQLENKVTELKSALSDEKTKTTELNAVITEKEGEISGLNGDIAELNVKNEKLSKTAEKFNLLSHLTVFLGQKLGLSNEKVQKMFDLLKKDFGLEYAFNKVTGAVDKGIEARG